MTSASEAATDRELPAVEYGLIRAHVLASLVTLLISASFGIIVATKLTLPEFLGGHGWLTWGRLRYDHTQGIFFGWLGNAFLAFSYYAVPRLANRAVSSRKLGWLLFGLWNFAVVLPHDEPLFPPDPGREQFLTACVVCHSPRYVTMQPRFSRSTWLSEVKKMKDVYGAHISDEQVAEITDYLVAINGKADTGQAPKGTYGE